MANSMKCPECNVDMRFEEHEYSTAGCNLIVDARYGNHNHTPTSHINRYWKCESCGMIIPEEAGLSG